MFRGAVKNDQRPLALSPTKSREGEIDGVFEAAKFSAARSPTCAIQTIFRGLAYVNVSHDSSHEQ